GCSPGGSPRRRSRPLRSKRWLMPWTRPGGKPSHPSAANSARGGRRASAAHPELQEREALKGLGLTAAMTGALRSRGVPDLPARVAAELGALALKIAYWRWRDPASGEFGEIRRRTLSEVQAVSAVSLR